jgi:hypothetical protein
VGRTNLDIMVFTGIHQDHPLRSRHRTWGIVRQPYRAAPNTVLGHVAGP